MGGMSGGLAAPFMPLSGSEESTCEHRGCSWPLTGPQPSAPGIASPVDEQQQFMMASPGSSYLTLQLHRDGRHSPWGFRLKGGVDVDGGSPFLIVKVVAGSASEGFLLPMDRVVAIDHQDISALTHLQAQNLIRSAGTAITMDIIRPCVDPAAVASACPTPLPFDHRAQSGSPISGTQSPAGYHYGFVMSSKPQLPTPKSLSRRRAQPSDTFKVIFESELDEIVNQDSISGCEFAGQGGQNTPQPVAPHIDPVLMDRSINQSATFRRVMESVIRENIG